MGERNVQVLNRSRICLPSREITSHRLFSAMAADISRSLSGIGASEVTSMSASLGLRHQMRHARRSSGSPKYTCPVLRRDLKRSKLSIFAKKTSTKFERYPRNTKEILSYDDRSSHVISIGRGIRTTALYPPPPVWIVVSDQSWHPTDLLAVVGGHPPLVRGACTACATRALRTTTEPICTASDGEAFGGGAP